MLGDIDNPAIIAGAFGFLALGSAMLIDSVGTKLRLLTAAVGLGMLSVVVIGWL